MTDKPICPLCKHEVPEPINARDVDIRGVAAYWIAELHEMTKHLAAQATKRQCDELALQEQIRRNVETIRGLLALW